jgi:hypothetical protein
LAIAAFALIWDPPRAGAQVFSLEPESTRPNAPFVALDLSGGVARNFEAPRWSLLGAATAGVGLYNGKRVLSFAAGVRGLRNDQRALVVTASHITLGSGVGMHGGALWDFSRDAPGASAGLSLALFNLQADLLFDDARTFYLSAFLRVPLGFLGYLALGGRR